MQIILQDNKYVYLDHLTDGDIDILWEEFTFEDPNVYATQNAQRSWQGKYRKFDKINMRLVRTFLGRLIYVCKKRSIMYDIVDKRPKWKYMYVDQKLIDEDFLPGIKLEQYQIDAIKTGIKCDNGIFKLTTGAGKCLGKDTPVMMFNGSVKMVQDIRIGDLLMGDDSTSRCVLSVCQGNENLYRVDQIYGDSYVVNESHILSLTMTPARKGQTHKIVDINVVDYLNSTKYDKHRLKGYKTLVDYPSKNIHLDPYFLGLWLGDGVSADTSFCLHEEDSKEVIDALYEYAESIGCVIHLYNEPSKANNYAIRLYEGIHAPDDYVAHTQNPFRRSLKNYGLLRNKHVPDDYIYNSREIRLQLLAGLIDSDGELNNNGYFVNLKNRSIVESCCIVARSLGFRANVTPNKKKSQTGYEGQYWKLSIWGDTDKIPVKTPYKKATQRLINKDPLVYGIELTELGEGDYYGFEIDGNKRFLLGDFTVTHNTEIIAGLCKAIDCPTIVLADMTIVVSQLRDRLQLREVESEIGMFFAGEKPNGERIVVGSVQSLNTPTPPKEEPQAHQYKNDKTFRQAHQRWKSSLLAYETRKRNYKMLTEYVKNAEMLIVDECDRSNSATYKHVIRQLYKGRRRYGFSGTPFDDSKPISNINIEENFGYIIHESGREEVEAAGRIVPVKYRMVVYQDDEYELHNKITLKDATDMFMVNNKQFHDMVFGMVRHHKGEQNMILVDRIPLGQNLAAYAKHVGINAEFIYGETPNATRDVALKKFENGELDVLIGGKILNRGLDIKSGIDNLIITTGGKLRSDFLQKIGRAVRVNKRGFSYVYDFLFRCNHYLYEHSKLRLKTIVDANYESSVNFGYTTIDGTSLIARNFTSPARPNTGRRGVKEKTLFHQ